MKNKVKRLLSLTLCLVLCVLPMMNVSAYYPEWGDLDDGFPYGPGDAISPEEGLFSDPSFEFECLTDEDGQTYAQLVDVNPGCHSGVDVPQTSSGYPVKSIGTGAISSVPYYSPDWFSIDLPATITRVESCGLSIRTDLVVTFDGPAPEIDESAFLDTKATVYYPCDPSWNEQVGQQFGGTLVWYASYDHNLDEGVVTKPSTCTENGEMVRTCLDCGAIRVERISASHTMDKVVSVEPTCTEAGETLYSCRYCDYSYTKPLRPSCINGDPDLCPVCNPEDNPGDVTGDGRLNIGDVAKIYAHAKGSSVLEEEALTLADINGDGRINIGDAAKLYARIKQ